MPGPLEGIRVLDLSAGAAGPWAAAMLGDMGADVIKLEPPGGEWGRLLGPPFVEEVAAAFLGLNRNKRSIVVDLKGPGGTDIVRRLATRSDVMIETFRPGVAGRLGIGYEALSANNPRLVYSAISAFGQEGPWRDRPGVDGVVQAMSGIMAVTGSEGGPPAKVGVPAADMCGGMFTLIGVLTALYDRERTGRGRRADVSLLDGLLAFQTVPLTMFMASGTPPGRLGSAAPYAAPNEGFPTADGHVMVAAYTPERWSRFCAAISRPELETDPRFATNDVRVPNRAELHEVLDPHFRTRTTSEWLEVLEGADLLCGPLLSYPELVSEEQVARHSAMTSFHHPRLGDVATVGNPVRLNGYPRGDMGPAPAIPGEHTESILTEAGYDHDEIDDLFDHRVVAGPRTAATGSR